MSEVNYLQFIDCTYDVKRQNEEPKNKLPRQLEEAYVGLPKY